MADTSANPTHIPQWLTPTLFTVTIFLSASLRSGQAIYLTHHRHVVDIAMQVCDSAPIVHEI